MCQKPQDVTQSSVCFFSYSIEFQGTKQHAKCDGLSRLSQPSPPSDKFDEVETFHTTVVEALPVMEQELRMQTHRDPALSHVIELDFAVRMGRNICSPRSHSLCPSW